MNSTRLVIIVTLLSLTAHTSIAKDIKHKLIAYCLNGDSITGECVALDKKSISIKPSYTRQALDLAQEKILHVEFQNSKFPEQSANNHEAIIELKDRYGYRGHHERLSGQVQQITPSHLTIKPPFSNPVSVDRSLINSFEIIRPASRIYSQVIDLDEWQTFGDPSAWTKTDAGIVAQNQEARIAKDFALPDLVKLSLKIDWKKRLGVSLYLFTDTCDRPTPKNSYELRLQHSYMYMSKTVDGVQVAQPHRIKHTNYSHKSQVTQIDILMDRKTGTFITFLNGTLVHTFTDPNPSPELMGGGIYILNSYNEPIRFKHLSIEHWNGNSDSTKKQYAIPTSISQSQETIQLINGDIVPGTATSVEDGDVIVDTEFSPQLRIPIDHIYKLESQAAPNQPKAEQHDVRITFSNGDQWIVEMLSLKNNTLTATNKAFGECEINLQAVKKLEFNIYDNQINATRHSKNW